MSPGYESADLICKCVMGKNEWGGQMQWYGWEYERKASFNDHQILNSLQSSSDAISENTNELYDSTPKESFSDSLRELFSWLQWQSIDQRGRASSRSIYRKRMWWYRATGYYSFLNTVISRRIDYVSIWRGYVFSINKYLPMKWIDRHSLVNRGIDPISNHNRRDIDVLLRNMPDFLVFSPCNHLFLVVVHGQTRFIFGVSQVTNF